MGRKDASFGVKHPNVLVSMKIRNYKEMFVEPRIYLRYVVLTIVIFTSMLAIELFYRTQLCSFHGCFFKYLPLFLCLHICGISLTRFKDFSTFWPCSFVYLLVKGIDNFWKIHGLIDRFNESRRQIASGIEKMADKSMSAIQFRTTPKGDLPHYSYIFRKPETLGKETNNLECSSLGTMLHLDIQKGEEAMKTSNFQIFL